MFDSDNLPKLMALYKISEKILESIPFIFIPPIVVIILFFASFSLNAVFKSFNDTPSIPLYLFKSSLPLEVRVSNIFRVFIGYLVFSILGTFSNLITRPNTEDFFHYAVFFVSLGNIIASILRIMSKVMGYDVKGRAIFIVMIYFAVFFISALLDRPVGASFDQLAQSLNTLFSDFIYFIFISCVSTFFISEALIYFFLKYGFRKD